MPAGGANSAGGDGAAATASSVEQRYSRQIYAVGANAMGRVLKARVAVVGLSSAGAELAKNILLSGVPAVALLDETAVCVPHHTESNFFLPRDASAAGNPRAASVRAALAPLNSVASVTVLSPSGADGGADEDGRRGAEAAMLVGKAGFGATAVALVDPLGMDGWAPVDVSAFTAAMHDAGIPLTMVEVNGLFTRLFNDFGPSFVVDDPLADPPAQFPVVSVDAVVNDDATRSGRYRAVLDTADHMLSMYDGDSIALTCGASHRLDCVVIDRQGADALTLNAAAGEPEALERFVAATANAGFRVVAQEVRTPLDLSFLPYSEAVGRAAELSVLSMTRDVAESAGLFAAVYAFAGEHGGRLPRLMDDGDAEALADTATNQFGVADRTVASAFARHCEADLVGMAAYVGGVAGQEVLKAITHRYKPATQFWHFDLRELAVADDGQQVKPAVATAAKLQPSHAAVFGGAAGLDRLRNADVFVVGAGAIGCEYLKNLALVGIGTGMKGRVTVTDYDSIEVSNLSRQFLFREQHVGFNKATTAAEAIRAVCGPKLKIRALQEKVTAETAASCDGVFNRRFWTQCQVICTAVDNMSAREFLDECAAKHALPMIDAGTQAARGHVEVFAPHATPRFREHRASAEKSIPFCTLHYFPTAIEHCIQFASDVFSGRFTNAVETAKRCVFEFDNVHIFASSLDPGVRLNTVRSVYDVVCADKPASWEDAVRWARVQFATTLEYPLRNLLESYPADMKDQDGQPYWRGAKRAPKLPAFDPIGSANHLALLEHGATLWARVHGIPVGSREAAFLAATAATAVLPEYVPTKVNADDKEDGDNTSTARPGAPAATAASGRTNAENEAEQKALLERIAAAASAIKAGARAEVGGDAGAATLCPEQFEKDDDSNSHVAFVAAVANIRAAAYGIPTADVFEVKRIAGRIVPAMITTTSVVTGIATLELCRLLTAGPSAALARSRPERGPSPGVISGWRDAVKGCANVSVLLSDLDGTQAFEPLPPTETPLFVTVDGNDQEKPHQGSPTFGSWATLRLGDSLHTSDATIGEVIKYLRDAYHGLVVTDIVEESRNVWLYRAGVDEARVLEFPLVLYAARMANISDEELKGIGRLSFVIRAEPPEAVARAGARVSGQLPPLVVPVTST